MGLFFNKKEHPDVYKNIKNIPAHNQSFVRHNSITELINEQQKTNMNLEKTIAEIKPRYEELVEIQTSQWKNVTHQINDLIVSNDQREDLDNKMIQQLDKLDENDSLINKSISDRMNELTEAYHEMLKRLEKNETTFEEISSLQYKQIDLQKEVADTLLKQEEFQSGVLKRLDNQEALTEKISRQLSNFRSILFERTNYLATKFEDGYHLTTSYFNKLINSSDQSSGSTLMKNKLKKNPKHTE